VYAGHQTLHHHPVNIQTLTLAKYLIQHYNFQIFDSIIVASSIEAGCEVLYSEDMQHNLNVEKQLNIINPFCTPFSNIK
jgi:predicted nucleic acid-binding protein